MNLLADLIKKRAFQITAAVALIAAGTVIIALTLLNRGPQDRYELTGKVVNVNERGQTVTIAHDPIPGYMVAMTMPFKLKDPVAHKIRDGRRRPYNGYACGGRLELVARRGHVRPRRRRGGEPRPARKHTPGMKPGEQVPNFTLVNQDGKPISIHQYHGRALALTFIYTRCPLPDVCPLMTSNFAEVGRALKTDPALYDSTRLLSITVDPAYDTPEVLRKYGAPRMADAGDKDFSHWAFATGSQEEVKHIAGYFGLWYRQRATR